MATRSGWKAQILVSQNNISTKKKHCFIFNLRAWVLAAWREKVDSDGLCKPEAADSNPGVKQKNLNRSTVMCTVAARSQLLQKHPALFRVKSDRFLQFCSLPGREWQRCRQSGFAPLPLLSWDGADPVGQQEKCHLTKWNHVSKLIEHRLFLMYIHRHLLWRLAHPGKFSRWHLLIPVL